MSETKKATIPIKKTITIPSLPSHYTLYISNHPVTKGTYSIPHFLHLILLQVPDQHSVAFFYEPKLPHVVLDFTSNDIQVRPTSAPLESVSFPSCAFDQWVSLTSFILFQTLIRVAIPINRSFIPSKDLPAFFPLPPDRAPFSRPTAKLVHYADDYTKCVPQVVPKTYSADQYALLAEFQLAFIFYVCLHSADAKERWQALLGRVCYGSHRDGHSDLFINAFTYVVQAQLSTSAATALANEHDVRKQLASFVSREWENSHVKSLAHTVDSLSTSENVGRETPHRADYML